MGGPRAGQGETREREWLSDDAPGSSIGRAMFMMLSCMPVTATATMHGCRSTSRKHRLFLRETTCLEISRHGSRLEARHVEADLIRNCKPRFNYQRPKLIEIEYRCQRCGRLWASRWSMSGFECLDKSGHGGTFDALCLGVLMPAVGWTTADMELWTAHRRIEISRA